MVCKRYIRFLIFTVLVWLSFFIAFQITLSYILNDFDNPFDSILFLIIGTINMWNRIEISTHLVDEN